MTTLKTLLKDTLPRPVYNALRLLALRSDHPAADYQDLRACLSFALAHPQHRDLIQRLYTISEGVDCRHRQSEMLAVMNSILSMPSTTTGVVVEAGCFKGGSTAKLSLAAALAHRQLVVFDSFQGIPANDESRRPHLFGGFADFPQGAYCGTLEEVRANVTRFGRIDHCQFVPGWFDDTMPTFMQPIVAAYLDVDLASSTRTCLKYLYPLMAPGGVLYSQDGHISSVVEVFESEAFWAGEVGCVRPRIEGLRQRKLLRIVKPWAF